MRVKFRRFPDHLPAYAVIERDDGTVYHLRGFTRGGTGLPHDLRHLVVERELRLWDGIYGGIAAGAVYLTMEHVSGRRPPHSAGRSGRLKQAYREQLRRAELLSSLVEAVAGLTDPSDRQIDQLARMKLAAVPRTEPGQDVLTAVALPPAAVLAAAARALQVEAARWARLRPGEELVYEWPGPVPRRGQHPALHPVPRPRQEPRPPRPASPGAAAPSVTCMRMSDDLVTAADRELMGLALEQARAGLATGGVPVGAVLAAAGVVLGAGRNERVQLGDPVAHGEISALRNAGRRASYAGTTLYSTLSPCQLCTGAILLFQIPRVVVGENRTFEGDLGFLRSQGVEVVLLDDPGCVSAMQEFQARYPEIWSEDIGGR